MHAWSYYSSARLAVVSLLCQGVALCACTYHVAVSDFSLPAPALTPLPLTVGLYFPPGLSAARNAQEIIGDTYEFSIGPGTIVAFRAAASGMFEDVVPLQQLPGPAADPGAPAGTIAVSAATVDFLRGVHVTYDIALYGADGDKRAAWSATGAAADCPTSGAINQGYFEPCTRVAMRDAIASWMVKFTEGKDVRSWLESVGVVPSAAPSAPEEHS